MSERDTTLFFALAIGITNLVLLPPALAALGVIPGPAEALMAGAPLAIFGPTIAATIASRREGGWPEVKRLFAGLVQWQVAPHWFVIALGLPTILWLVGRSVYALVPGSESTPWLFLPGDATRVVGAILVPLGEEIGWRGFALPRLVARHGPVRASLVLGGLWALWHTCMLLCVGTPVPLIVLGMLQIFVGSFLFTWLFQRTGGSLLLAVLLHVGVHLSNTSQSFELAPTVITLASYTLLGGLLVALDREAFAPSARAPLALERGAAP
ncbi:MAG: CPBP family intramembrane metalloprotease [Sandaracinaceae bacterium]|nr:CPBP family intramembrane metalloprotease [Sandaracinaceae bacterium]